MAVEVMAPVPDAAPAAAEPQTPMSPMSPGSPASPGGSKKTDKAWRSLKVALLTQVRIAGLCKRKRSLWASAKPDELAGMAAAVAGLVAIAAAADEERRLQEEEVERQLREEREKAEAEERRVREERMAAERRAFEDEELKRREAAMKKEMKKRALAVAEFGEKFKAPAVETPPHLNTPFPRSFQPKAKQELSLPWSPGRKLVPEVERRDSALKVPHIALGNFPHKAGAKATEPDRAPNLHTASRRRASAVPWEDSPPNKMVSPDGQPELLTGMRGAVRRSKSSADVFAVGGEGDAALSPRRGVSDLSLAQRLTEVRQLEKEQVPEEAKRLPWSASRKTLPRFQNKSSSRMLSPRTGPSPSSSPRGGASTSPTASRGTSSRPASPSGAPLIQRVHSITTLPSETRRMASPNAARRALSPNAAARPRAAHRTTSPHTSPRSSPRIAPASAPLTRRKSAQPQLLPSHPLYARLASGQSPASRPVSARQRPAAEAH